MTDAPTSALRQAQVLVDLRRYADAIPLLHQVIASDLTAVIPRCLLAQCYLGVEDPATALDTASRAVAVAPEEEWPHRLRSVALARLGRNVDAIAAARQAVVLAPAQSGPYLALSSAELASGHLAEAQQAAEKARELAPSSPEAYNTLGLVALQRKKPAEAEALFRAALSHNPEHAAAMNNLGVALLRQGRKQQAVHYFGEASKLNPQMSVARRNAVGAAKVGVPILFVVFLVLNLARAAASGLVAAVAVAAAIAVVAVIHVKREARMRAQRGERPEDPVASRKMMRDLRRDPLARQIRNPRLEMVITLWLGLLAVIAVVAGVAVLVTGDLSGLLVLAIGAAALGGLVMLRRRWRGRSAGRPGASLA